MGELVEHAAHTPRLTAPELMAMKEAGKPFILLDGRTPAEFHAMNIDGATAVIFCELGFPPPLSRGLFCLSRSVGVLAHGWEQMQQGGRNKGPMPPKFLPEYQAAPKKSDN